MKYHILVVEDQAPLRGDICDILDLEGYTTSEANHGLEALDVIQQAKPHLILCDIYMPQMDGITFLKKLRASDEYMNIPFIFLSAKIARNDTQDYLDIGANKCISKPFKIEDLLNAIEELIQS